MSSLSNITYADGDIVWVRLSNCWWPGEVCDQTRLPEGLWDDLKKKPIAIVRFFQEETFEYIYNIDHICSYNSHRKNDFLKKGLDGYRANKKFLDKFPADVETAERRTNGDPDIINSFQTEPKKRSNNWDDIFADPNKAKKKTKESPKGRQKSDHEVRIMEQKNSPSTPGASSSNAYTCSVCSFATTRLNVLILHNKSHTKEELATPKVVNTPKSAPAKTTPKTKTLREVKQPSVIDDYFDDDLDEETTPKAKKKKKAVKSPRTSTPKKTIAKKVKETKVEPVAAKPVEEEPQPPVVSKNEITKNLLADWSDDELTLDDVTKPTDSEPTALKEASSVLTFDDLKNELEGKDSDTALPPPPPPLPVEIEKPSSSSVVTTTAATPTTPVASRTIPKKQTHGFLLDVMQRDEEALAKLSAKKKSSNKKGADKKTPAPVEPKDSDRKSKRLEKGKATPIIPTPPVVEEKEPKRTPRPKATPKESKSAKSRAKAVNDLFNILKDEDEKQQPQSSKRKSRDVRKTPVTPTTIDLSNGAAATPATASTSTKRESSRRIQNNKNSAARVVSMYQTIEPSPSTAPDSVESQIAALLDETAPPVFEPKLPPKERNKRIFKTTTSIPRIESPAKTESELQIAETLTQLPQTAIQFSPSKEAALKKSTDSTTNDSSNKPKPLYENPRKRPLRALGDGGGGSSKLQQESQQLAKRQKMEPAAVIPKKRKTEYTALFEEQQQHLPAIESLPKIPRLSQRQKLDQVAATSSSSTPTTTVVENNLFDIEKMDIIYYNDNIQDSGIIEEVVEYSPSSTDSSSQSVKPKTGVPQSKVPSTKIPHHTTKPDAKHRLTAVTTKIIQRPSSVIGAASSSQPLKTAEIRRLSSPLSMVAAKRSSLETMRHDTQAGGFLQNTLKVVTAPDGTKKLIEEFHTAPGSTQKIVLRASSSSPLSKFRNESPIKSVVSTTVPKSQIVQKGKVIQAASNKIVITSKGQLITTTSPVSQTVQAPSRISRIDPGIKSPNKIHVQSEIILPSSTMTTRIQPSEIKPMLRKKELIIQHQRAQERPKPKKELIKMTPKQLQEAERLGHVEFRNGSKVLSKAGMRHFFPSKATPFPAPMRKYRDVESTSDGSIDSPSFKTVRRKSEASTSASSSSSSVIILDGDEVSSSPPPPSQPTSIKPRFIKKPPITNVDDTGAILIPDDNISEDDGSQTGKETATVTTKDVINVPGQDGQILAVPADSFGGPSNAFYLCTAGEDGNLTPINNDALYLDASNNLVPVAPPDTSPVKPAAMPPIVDNSPGDDVVVVPEPNEGQLEPSSQSIILSTGDGQQIVLDQQILLALANSGTDPPQIMTPDGQQIILPGSAQEILTALAVNQGESILIQAGGDLAATQGVQSDILATALANTEVFQQEQLLNDVVVSPPVKAHVSETNAVLTQPPIMSTSEQPSNGDTKPASQLLSKNLDDSLAEIGVVSTHHTTVPSSLELPITVTNPAIATVAVAVSSAALAEVPSSVPPQQISPSLSDLQLITNQLPAAVTAAVSDEHDEQVVDSAELEMPETSTTAVTTPITESNEVDTSSVENPASDAVVGSSTSVSGDCRQSYEEQSKLIDSTTGQTELAGDEPVESSEAEAAATSSIENYEESTSLSPPTQRSSAVLTPESADEIIPDTPDPVTINNKQQPDGLSDVDTCFSSEIPIQPNSVSCSSALADSQEPTEESQEQPVAAADDVSDSVNNNDIEKDETSEAEPATIDSNEEVVQAVAEPMEVDQER